MQIAYEIELKPELRSAIGLPNNFDHLFYIPKYRMAIATNETHYALTYDDSTLKVIDLFLDHEKFRKISDPVELIILNQGREEK